MPKIKNHGQHGDENLERQRETFVASLSHDLKNPTIAQIRALELFLKGYFGKLLPKQQEVLTMVLDSCKYMNAMLCSLLTTYTTSFGTINLENEEVSITNLAEECIEEVIFLAKDKGINISVVNDSVKDSVWGDKVQIKRVIMNLLYNGIKYAYRNSTLYVKVYNENNCTCFSFENKSPYIESDRREKIFARYVSFASAHQEFGTGLGLYTSKKIVEAHQGEIFVHSYKNDTNIFGFKIPNSEEYKDKIRKVTF